MFHRLRAWAHDSSKHNQKWSASSENLCWTIQKYRIRARIRVHIDARAKRSESGRFAATVYPTACHSVRPHDSPETPASRVVLSMSWTRSTRVRCGCGTAR
jgi:hypothetical protein